MLPPAETKSLQPDSQFPRSDVIKDQSDSGSIQRLPICEIEAVPFAHLSAKPDHETFSLSLRDLDQYLDGSIEDIPPVPEAIPSSGSIPLRYIPDKHLSGSENQYQENLFKMTKALSLATNVTTAEIRRISPSQKR